MNLCDELCKWYFLYLFSLAFLEFFMNFIWTNFPQSDLKFEFLVVFSWNIESFRVMDLAKFWLGQRLVWPSGPRPTWVGSIPSTFISLPLSCALSLSSMLFLSPSFSLSCSHTCLCLYCRLFSWSFLLAFGTNSGTYELPHSPLLVSPSQFVFPLFRWLTLILPSWLMVIALASRHCATLVCIYVAPCPCPALLCPCVVAMWSRKVWVALTSKHHHCWMAASSPCHNHGGSALPEGMGYVSALFLSPPYCTLWWCYLDANVCSRC